MIKLGSQDKTKDVETPVRSKGKHMIKRSIMISQGKCPSGDGRYRCESDLGHVIGRRIRPTFLYVAVKSLLAVHTHELSVGLVLAPRVIDRCTCTRGNLQTR